ncbi:exported protein of unknown function [Nitrosopumilus adriaticus]|uniref:Uncharacterized protein n=2 Tax=Nitrosopumilus adriaticus TaxID=1580092 RepID=A0A0D5C118_9ARCH|nr:exported protein of unknown function [Nitrosopumilus adriaticus]
MKLSMNSKTKYMIPAFAAVFALMFVAALPGVMAEGGDYAKMGGDKYHKKGHGHKAILVEGFTGSIVIPAEMTKETHAELKSQVTVSLGQAVSVAESNGVTDAMKAKIGIAKDGEDNKFVVWKIISIDRDEESQTKTKNIFVVDAGDSTNFTSISKTYDHSKMKGDKMDRKIEKFQQKFSEPTGDADVDAARAQFLDLLQQLRDAYENGDSETAKSIKEQLKELKDSVFLNMRSSHI